MPENLSLRQWSIRLSSGVLEEQYQGGEEGKGVYCQAHVLLQGAKYKTVLGGEGGKEEEKSGEREDWSR